MILARKGEIVTCENGHEICDVMEDIDTSKEQVIRSALFGNWRDGKKHGPSGSFSRCPDCDAPFIVHTGGRKGMSVLGRENCFVLHVGNEWR